MGALKLKFACSRYDRIEPLRDGRVKPDGIDLEVVSNLGVRELFDAMMQGSDFDLAEFSSSEHIAMTCAGGSPFVALPVFVSKAFRLGFVTINRRNGVNSPKDLAGKRIGVPLYTMSAALWCRGMLEDEYGVDFSNVTWVQGAVEKPGSHGNPHPPPLLKPVKIEINTSPYSLGTLLAKGEIDAILGAVLPPELRTHEDVVRLFPDFRQIEKDYYRRTRIHPIMHLVAIRKGVFEANPWIARSLYEAFNRAKAMAWQEAIYDGAQKYMLPFLYDDIEEIHQVFDGDPWPYGLTKNRPTLLKQIEYMHRQAMIARQPSLDEIFADVGE